MIITSVNNEIVKDTAKLHQKKFRDESGMFLLEGDKCIEEAMSSGVEIIRIFVEKGFNKFKNLDIIETNQAVLSKITTTDSAPKCAAVAKKVKKEWSNNYKNVILLENIKDAGNLGTIIRTACAFNIDAVILYGDTVDMYNPKCVRASVGNLWKIPVFEIKNFNELIKYCKNFTPVATLPKSHNSVWLNDYKKTERQLIMFGTESDGLSRELIDFASKKGKILTIEMSDKVESLNLSIAAGVILYKIFSDKICS